MMKPQILPWQTEQWQFWQQQTGRYGHAYLLAGSQGLGLADFARMMAKSLLCENPQPGLVKPCNACKSCHLFEVGAHPDLFELEILEKKTEIGIDQIRKLNHDLHQTAHQAGFKVAIIKQAEKLNTNAFNSLLKTLEEPPIGTILILTTEQIKHLPATILSRCLQIDFNPPAIEASQAWLQAETQLEPDLIKRALQLNWGAPLSALSWLHQEGWQQDQQWKQDMASVANQQKTISEVVTTWLKWPEPEQVFNQFYRLSVQKIRAAVYANQPAANWFEFQQQLLNAKQEWQQNANKELLLESLGLQCLQALAQEN